MSRHRKFLYRFFILLITLRYLELLLGLFHSCAFEDLETHYQDVDFKGIGKVEFYECYGTLKLNNILTDTSKLIVEG